MKKAMERASSTSCPICKKDVKPRSENVSFPFCSARCKTIDLGKWVNEEYRIAGESSELDEEELGSETNPPEPEKPVRH
jgi:uncharacterized protein